MTHVRRNIALVMVAGAVAQSFGRFTWALLLPAVEDDLLGSYGQAGTLGTANVAAYLAGSAAVTALSGRFAPTVLVRAGLVASTTGLAVMAVADGFLTLLVGMVVMGLGGAFIWIPSPGLASAAVPPEKRGLAMGFVSMGIGTGIFATSQLTALLRLWLGSESWRPVWAVEAAIGLATLAAVWRWLEDDPEVGDATGVRLDILRTVPGWVPLTTAYAAYGLGYSIHINYLVAGLEEDAGFSPRHASLTYSGLGLAVIVGGIVLGRLSDRVGRRRALVVGFAVMAVCICGPLIGREPVVTPLAFGFGLMFSGLPAVIAAALRDELDPRSFGAAFGAMTLAFGLGQVLGPQIGGWIGDARGSFDLAFVLSAAAITVGAVASWLLPRRPADEPTPVGG